MFSAFTAALIFTSRARMLGWTGVRRALIRAFGGGKTPVQTWPDPEEDEHVKQGWTYFWGGHQRFFKELVTQCKVPATVAQAKKALEEGKSVVIGLQGTGEARTGAA